MSETGEAAVSDTGKAAVSDTSTAVVSESSKAVVSETGEDAVSDTSNAAVRHGEGRRERHEQGRASDTNKAAVSQTSDVPKTSGAGEVAEELTAWVDERLREAGRRRIGPIAVPRQRPWGTVMTAETDAGRVWLKLPAPAVAFEIELYRILHRLVPNRVLEPIAADPALGRLLLPDGGPVLRDLFDGVELDEAFVKVLPLYGELQRSLAPAVGQLLAVGVVDMRPAVLLQRFDEAVEAAGPAALNGRTAAAAEAGAAVQHERFGEAAARARGVRERFSAVATALAASRVPASLDHADLHSGNVFAGDGQIFDWGDSVLAHPFASMLVALQGGDEGRRRDAYLEAFTDLAPRAELLEDLRNARIAGNVIRALTWHRALTTGGAQPAGEWAAGPAAHVNQLATAAPWECP